MRRAKSEGARGWGIVSGEVLLPATLRPTRRQAIADFEAANRRGWKALAAAGYRCIRVNVTYEKSAVSHRH